MRPFGAGRLCVFVQPGARGFSGSWRPVLRALRLRVGGLGTEAFAPVSATVGVSREHVARFQKPPQLAKQPPLAFALAAARSCACTQHHFRGQRTQAHQPHQGKPQTRLPTARVKLCLELAAALAAVAAAGIDRHIGLRASPRWGKHFRASRSPLATCGCRFRHPPIQCISQGRREAIHGLSRAFSDGQIVLDRILR